MNRSLEKQLEDIVDEIDAASIKIRKVGGVVDVENDIRACEGCPEMTVADLNEAEHGQLKSARTSLHAALKYTLELIGEDT